MRLRDPQRDPAYVSPALASVSPPGRGLPVVPHLHAGAGLSRGNPPTGRDSVGSQGIGVRVGAGIAHFMQV